MSDISNLTDQEKSIMLARVMGHYAYAEQLTTGEVKHFVVEHGRIVPAFSIYEPRYMFKAWRVQLLVLDLPAAFKQRYKDWLTFKIRHEQYFHEDMQAQILDRILELAIEAGLVEMP